MFNFLNKAVGLFHTKPSVSYLQPKTINVYFKNAIKPKYILLNINHYDYCELEVISSNVNNENIFILVANLHGPVDTQLELGIFETRVEAEKALLVLRNKLFGLDKKLVKFTTVFLILTVLVGLFGNAFDGLLRRGVVMSNIPATPITAPAANSNFVLPTNMSPQEIADLQKKVDVNNIAANKNANAPAAQTPATVAPQTEAVSAPETSNNPEVNNLLNNLSK